MVVIAPLAAAMAGLKIVSAVSGALGNKGGGTPNVSIPRNQKPKAENYDKELNNKDKTQEQNNDPGTGSDPSSGIQPRTEQKVTTGEDGMMKIGERTPIKGSGFTMNQTDYEKLKRTGQM